MKLNGRAAGVVIVSVISGIAAFFAGCAKDTISDEFARISAQEVSNMDANASTMVGALGPLPKMAAAAAADTVYYDWKVVPYQWDAASGSYIRTATFTNLSDGYTRVRVDTVTFLDDNSTKLQYPTLATIDSIRHIRNVTRTRGGNELNIRVVMSSAINLSPDTTHVKNGIITGTYDGETVQSHGIITNVTRQYTGGHWQFPRSGNIFVDFPRRSFEVEFTGNGNATLTATNKSTDKTRVVTIHVEQR